MSLTDSYKSRDLESGLILTKFLIFGWFSASWLWEKNSYKKETLYGILSLHSAFLWLMIEILYDLIGQVTYDLKPTVSKYLLASIVFFQISFPVYFVIYVFIYFLQHHTSYWLFRLVWSESQLEKVTRHLCIAVVTIMCLSKGRIPKQPALVLGRNKFI